MTEKGSIIAMKKGNDCLYSDTLRFVVGCSLDDAIKEASLMNMRNLVFCVFVVMIFVAGGCSKQSDKVTVLKKFPVDNLNEIITQSGVGIVKDVSSDGNGSLRIIAKEPSIVRLFEVNDIDIEDARLIYQAKVRTGDVKGQVYLEMWCHFPGKGEFFSRGLDSPLTGTTNWATLQIPFFLKKGEKPDYIKLNIVINGTGTVWIDDVRLLKAPLQ